MGAGDRIRKDLMMDCSVHTGTVRFQGKQARKPKQYEDRGSRIGSRMSHLHGIAWHGIAWYGISLDIESTLQVEE